MEDARLLLTVPHHLGVLWQILVPLFEGVHRRRVNIEENLEAETNIH